MGMCKQTLELGESSQGAETDDPEEPCLLSHPGCTRCVASSGAEACPKEGDPEKADWPLLELTSVKLTHVDPSSMNCRMYQTSDPHSPHPFGRPLHAACENHSFTKWRGA